MSTLSTNANDNTKALETIPRGLLLLDIDDVLCLANSSAGFALVSAVLWALSAFVNFPFGYDMDRELNVAMSRAARFNAWAAASAAGATVCQGIAMYLDAKTKGLIP